MDRLNEFKSYIKAKINEVNDNKDFIKQSNDIIDKLNSIYSALISRNYTELDAHVLNECFGFIFSDEDKDLKLNKLREAIIIVNNIKDESFPQVKSARIYIEEICNIILKRIQLLKSEVLKRKSEISDKISEYEEFYTLINDGKIVRHLDEDELKCFFEFLNESSLDKKAILDLVILFTKDSIDYAERLRNLRIVKENAIKKTNTAKVKEKIDKQNKENIEDVEVNDSDFALSEEENKVYYQILDIINELQKDIDLTHDALCDLLKGDYSLVNRKSIYESTDDKFNLILEDLKVNLIPGVRSNKDSVIEVFKYIIDIYNKEYTRKDNVSFISQVDDFNEEEQAEINRYLLLAEKELGIYNNLDDRDKNVIESIKQLIESSDETVEIDPKYSLNYVKFILLIKKFNTLYNEYLDCRKNEREYVTSGLQDDINSCLISQMNDLRDILRKLNRAYEILSEERGNVNTELNEENKDFTPKRKTILVFLPLTKKDTYSANEDQEEVLKVKKEVMKDVSDGLYNFSVNDYQSFITSQNTAVLKKNYRDIQLYGNFKPYRIRKGESRIAYAKIPLSKNNQERIKEAYDVEKADVVLIIGFREKLTGTNKIYDYFSSRMDRESEEIQYIFNLFGNDFDEASFKACVNLIDDSDKICKELFEKPMEKIDTFRLGGK